MNELMNELINDKLETWWADKWKNAIKDYKNTKSTANKSIKKNGIPNFMINNECIC